MFLTPGSTDPLGPFVVRVTAEAVLCTWVYNSTRGSLLLVTLLHAAGNTAGVFLPVDPTKAGLHISTLVIRVVLELVLVAAVTAIYGAAKLSRAQARQAPG
jgi:membrane protease YdiL (CAAX protease family)